MLDNVRMSEGMRGVCMLHRPFYTCSAKVSEPDKTLQTRRTAHIIASMLLRRECISWGYPRRPSLECPLELISVQWLRYYFKKGHGWTGQYLIMCSFSGTESWMIYTGSVAMIVREVPRAYLKCEAADRLTLQTGGMTCQTWLRSCAGCSRHYESASILCERIPAEGPGKIFNHFCGDR